MLIRDIAAATAAVLALSVAGAASAAVTQLQFSAPGAGQQIYFNGLVENTNLVDPDIHATFNLTLDSITSGGYAWNFSYQLANTSTATSRLSVIGWDVAANPAASSNVAGLFTIAGSGNMSTLGPKEFCLKAGGGAGNCSGGGSGGLWNGTSGAGAFTYTFADSALVGYHTETVKKGKKTETIQVADYASVAAPTSVLFDNFGVRYQALGDGNSTVGVPDNMPTPQEHEPTGVPEPATWAMLILGFFGLGAMVRRRTPLAQLG